MLKYLVEQIYQRKSEYTIWLVASFFCLLPESFVFLMQCSLFTQIRENPRRLSWASHLFSFKKIIILKHYSGSFCRKYTNAWVNNKLECAGKPCVILWKQMHNVCLLPWPNIWFCRISAKHPKILTSLGLKMNRSCTGPLRLFRLCLFHDSRTKHILVLKKVIFCMSNFEQNFPSFCHFWRGQFKIWKGDLLQNKKRTTF